MSEQNPSATAVDGQERDGQGRFLPGNRAAVGNPHNRAAQLIRSAMFGAVDLCDVIEIVRALVERAKAGDVQAAREIFDRTLGRPLSTSTVDLSVSGGLSASLPRLLEKSDEELDEIIRAADLADGGLPLPLTEVQNDGEE